MKHRAINIKQTIIMTGAIAFFIYAIMRLLADCVMPFSWLFYRHY